MCSYSIGQVAEMFGLPISTLRYYDKEGLFPELARNAGRRQFSDREIEALRVIECLKASGLEIKDIKQFMQWCSDGPSTYEKRKQLFKQFMQWCSDGPSTYAARRQLFEDRRKAVEEEMQQLRKTLDLLNYKCWYYETAMKDGTEDNIQDMLPDKLPADIQKLYDNSFR